MVLFAKKCPSLRGKKKKDLRKIQDKDLWNKTKQKTKQTKNPFWTRICKKKEKEQKNQSFHTLHSAKQQDSAFSILISDP